MVERTDILHETGRSLNRAIDLGQVEGGFIQGMGWLTSEELWFDVPKRQARLDELSRDLGDTLGLSPRKIRPAEIPEDPRKLGDPGIRHVKSIGAGVR